MATKECTTNTSDEHFDFSCTPCNKKGKNNEALKYCIDCQEYLCGSCEESHNSFSVLAGHILVGRSKFGGVSGSHSGDLPSVPTERCEQHSLKLVDMYCADHDTVGCHVCFTIDHKFCQGIHYIPEYIQKNNQTEEEIKTIKMDLEQAMSAMDTALKKKQEAIENNKEERASFLAEIQKFKKEINEVLDQLEQASVTELDSKCRRLEEDLHRGLKMIQDTVEKLTTRKTEIEKSQRNPSQQFVDAKLSKRILNQIDKNNVEKMTCLRNGFTVQSNSEILNVLKNLKVLITFTPRKVELYKVSNKTTHNIRKREEEDCDVWSSCLLHSGDILLADHSNKNIKLVDQSTYNIKDFLKLRVKPTSICNVNNDEVAACLNNQTVQFISTQNQLAKTRVLKFDHPCRGIAFLDGQLVMGNKSGKIYMYTMNGERLKNIEKDNTGRRLFSYIRYLCPSDNRKMLHIVDRERCVTTIDRDGGVVLTYAGQELSDPWGVCTDNSGSLFVSGSSSKNVVQIDLNGQLLGEIVSNEHDLNYPRAVCFDKKQYKLIVADRNEICVFKLQ